jgi:hypothetical protein
MAKSTRWVLHDLILIAVFLAGSSWSGSPTAKADDESTPMVYVSASHLTVYYPDRKRIYVYSDIGGNCVFAYTLTTPGGPVTRENCR